MWEKIVLNLISNAFKFTFEGEIEVKVRHLGKHFELSVRDTGTGIPDAELPRIFDRFHRVANASGRSHEGSGIGLALVQELVRLHGGSVSVESRQSIGSTFRVLIPAGASLQRSGGKKATPRVRSTIEGAQSYVEEALRWLPDAGSLSAVNQPSAKTSGSRPRIIVADDNTDMQGYVARLLDRDYDVFQAADGLQALEVINQISPDLVLSDIMMPRLDGLALLHALRSQEATKTLPVILLSARAGEEARVEGLAAGADDYLVKPFSARELVVRVASTLELSRVRREAAEQERSLRIQAETARERLDNVLAGIDDQFVIFDRDWQYVYINDQVLEVTGKPREELLGSCVWSLFPDIVGTDIHKVLVEVAATGQAGRLVFFYEPYGSWFDVRIYPSSEGITVIATDVTEQKKAEEKQALLTNELNHRVKNTLAVVQAIAGQTARFSPEPLTFKQAFTGRIAALARVHDVLTQASWMGTSLEAVARASVAPFNGAGAIRIDGPHVDLEPVSAVTFSLALNELGTNAAKYGALSKHSGFVTLDWVKERNCSGLRLVWKEHAGPAVKQPARTGFGSLLLERLASQLGGTVTLEYLKDGLRCEIVAPVKGGRVG
jgi:PAS domain S-box-containing protein